MLLDEKKIREWLNLEPMAVIRDLVEMIVDCGWKDFVAYLDCFSADVGSRLWGLIAPLFWSDGAMVELERIVDPNKSTMLLGTKQLLPYNSSN